MSSSNSPRSAVGGAGKTMETKEMSDVDQQMEHMQIREPDSPDRGALSMSVAGDAAVPDTPLQLSTPSVRSAQMTPSTLTSAHSTPVSSPPVSLFHPSPVSLVSETPGFARAIFASQSRPTRIRNNTLHPDSPESDGSFVSALNGSLLAQPPVWSQQNSDTNKNRTSPLHSHPTSCQTHPAAYIGVIPAPHLSAGGERKPASYSSADPAGLVSAASLDLLGPKLPPLDLLPVGSRDVVYTTAATLQKAVQQMAVLRRTYAPEAERRDSVTGVRLSALARANRECDLQFVDESFDLPLLLTTGNNDLSHPQSFNTIPVRRCPLAAEQTDLFTYLPSVLMRSVKPMQVGEATLLLRDPHSRRIHEGPVPMMLQCQCGQMMCQFRLHCPCTDDHCPWPDVVHSGFLPHYQQAKPVDSLRNADTAHMHFGI